MTRVLNHIYPHRAQRPLLYYFFKKGIPIFSDWASITSYFCPVILDSETTNRKDRKEFNIEYLTELYSQRLPKNEFEFPTYFNSGKETLQILHGICTRSTPQLVVETGVANGFSTIQLLESMPKGATLISFDVEYKSQMNVLNLVEFDNNSQQKFSQDILQKWVYVNLDGKTIRSRRKDITNCIEKSVGKIDLWYHDSDHSYTWQIWEYEMAWNALRIGGFLISDDIDSSMAFYDFVEKKINSRVALCFDTRKFCGIVQKL